MVELYVVGTVILILGILMIVFNDKMGIGFCLLGKAIFKNSPFRDQFPVDSVYDESKAPRIFKLLGIGNIVQSPLFFLMGWLLKNY